MVKTYTGNQFYYYEVDALAESIRNEIISRRRGKKKAVRKVSSKKTISKKNGNRWSTHRVPSFRSLLVPLVHYGSSKIPLTTTIWPDRELYLLPGLIEAGYGQLLNWKPERIISKKEINDDLVNYSLNRIRLAMSCITGVRDREYRMKEFFSVVEPAEKADISFIIGGAFCYFSAINWLSSRMDKMVYFLHANLLTSASLKPVTIPETKSMPDYLVFTRGREWHVFESKGGSESEKWKRIEEGLNQLGIVTAVEWDGAPSVPVTSAVCTHASVDAGRAIETTVVDPEYSESHVASLHRPVVVLANAIMILDIYDHFASDHSERRFLAAKGWVLARSSTLKSLEIAIPREFIYYEKEIRLRLGLYLAIKEMVDHILMNYGRMSISFLKELVHRKYHDLDEVLILFEKIDFSSLQGKSYRNILLIVSGYLRLKYYAYRLDIISTRLISQLPYDMRKYLTPAGSLSGVDIAGKLSQDTHRRGDLSDPVP